MAAGGGAGGAHLRERRRDRAGLAGFDPASAAIEAGRIMLRRLDELRRAGADFAFETALSGLAHRRTIRRLHESGYETHLVYLWLPSPDTAVERVRTRVRLGGHDVPERDVRRRYWRSVANFELYRTLVTRWWVYHAAGAIGAQPSIIAEGDGEVIRGMHDENAWAALQRAAASGPHEGEEHGH